MARRLVEKITNRGAKRARKNECGPEKKHPRDIGPKVQRRKEKKARTKQQSATIVSETRVVRDPIAQSSTQGLGKRDRNQ